MRNAPVEGLVARFAPKKRWNEMVRVWSKPVIVEIAVGMEINCYACAELD
ncbi:MAG: pyrroloquinoline quinone precursor peptide PqqA [Alphaproteobacteria bacterium]